MQALDVTRQRWLYPAALLLCTGAAWLEAPRHPAGPAAVSSDSPAASGPGGENLFFAYVPAEGHGFLVSDEDRNGKSTLIRVPIGADGSIDMSRASTFATGTRESRDVMSPSFVRQGGRDWVYFLAGPSDGLPVQVLRVRAGIAPGTIPEIVALPDRLGVRSWPRFQALADGSVAAAYRDTASTARFASSSDGVNFAESTPVSGRAAMAAMGELGDGSIAFSYQARLDGEMKSWMTVASRDRSAWSGPRLIHPESGNVHDASFFRRGDGGLDVYFLSPNASATGFAVWRRCLTGAGNLGSEERVLDQHGRSFAKPYVFRHASGAIGLAVSDMTRGSRLQVYPIPSEAECVIKDASAGPLPTHAGRGNQ